MIGKWNITHFIEAVSKKKYFFTIQMVYCIFSEIV